MIPIAAVIGVATAVGVGAERRLGEAAERAAQRLMSIVLWVLLPIVAFFNIATLEVTAEVGAGIGFAYLASAATLGAAYLIGKRLLGLDRPGVGALMNAATLGNTGYLGLPFTVALFGFDELPNAVAYDLLVSSFLLVTIGFSVGAAFGTRDERPLDRVRSFFTRNPALWATLGGLLAPAVLTPEWAVDASRVLLVAILPLGFFALGVTLAAESRLHGTGFLPPVTAPVSWAVGLKILLPPAIVLGLSSLLLEVPESYWSQAAMASALNTLIVAHEFGLDRGLAAGAIAWSTTIVVAAGAVAALM